MTWWKANQRGTATAESPCCLPNVIAVAFAMLLNTKTWKRGPWIDRLYPRLHPLPDRIRDRPHRHHPRLRLMVSLPRLPIERHRRKRGDDMSAQECLRRPGRRTLGGEAMRICLTLERDSL